MDGRMVRGTKHGLILLTPDDIEVDNLDILVNGRVLDRVTSVFRIIKPVPRGDKESNAIAIDWDDAGACLHWAAGPPYSTSYSKENDQYDPEYLESMAEMCKYHGQVVFSATGRRSAESLVKLLGIKQGREPGRMLVKIRTTITKMDEKASEERFICGYEECLKHILKWRECVRSPFREACQGTYCRCRFTTISSGDMQFPCGTV
jgi:hypothetical protein